MKETATRTNRAYEVLQANVDQIRSTDQWKAALKVRSKFHKYSFHNAMLIALQCPDATMIAGYRKWQELGRQVRKGEKSIAILAPIIVKDKESDDEKAKKLVGFRATSVFDVSQTDGEELPMPPAPKLLEGDSEDIATAIARVTSYVTADLGVSIEYVDPSDLGGANGVYRPDNRSIAVRSDVAPAQQLKTLVHETAHAVLHSNGRTFDLDVQLAEVEAESCAYLVNDALGFDTGDYSFAYVAHWAGETDALLKAGQTACKAAEQILDAITATAAVAS